MKKNKSVVQKDSKKQKADRLRRKAIRADDRTNRFANKWIEASKKNPKLSNSKTMEEKYTKLSKADTKAYKEYQDYVHDNWSNESIVEAKEACLKKDVNRKNRGFMSKSFINRLK